MTRRWTINGRFLTQPPAGVQRYAREIVQELDLLISQGHPLARGLAVDLLAPRGAAMPENLRAIGARAVGRGGGHLWEQTFLPAAVPGGLISLCNSGPVAARRHIVCIHDVNTRIVPQSYSFAFRALYRVLLPALGRSAAAIATVSNFSASEIERHGVAPRDKITVIPDGHEHALRWRAGHSPATRAAAGSGTVVAIGSRAPHKNLKLLLGLAEKMAEAGLRLAVAGMADARVFAGETSLPQAEDVVWLGRLSDGELAALFHDCLCLAQPSLTEGFGLPAVEAMALGCPVVASDRGSLPEICGDAALYAAPSDGAAWLRHFISLRDDAELRAQFVDRGASAAARYSWRRSAEQYLELMSACDGAAAGSPAEGPARHSMQNRPRATGPQEPTQEP